MKNSHMVWKRDKHGMDDPKEFLCQGKCLRSPHDWLSLELKVVSKCFLSLLFR